MYCILNGETFGPLGRRGMELTSEIMRRHYRRDWDFVWDQLAESVMWIGPLRTQFTNGLRQLQDTLECEKDFTFTMEREHYQVVCEYAVSCIVPGHYYVTSDPGTDFFLRTLQRVSFCYRLCGDRLKVVHMHVSHPYEVMEPDEVFPLRFGKDVYEYVEHTRRMAFTDSPTGPGNRHAYEAGLVYLSREADKQGLCFILFDLNGMKAVNDTLGHLAGDDLLRRFAALVRDSMPPEAHVYRYGGDEFVVTLRSGENAAVEAYLRDLERRREAANAGNVVPLSFAWGYAFYDPATDRGLSETVRRADAMLYARKKASKGATLS